jgi:hypothetical protein
MVTVQEKAKEFRSWFELGKRDDGSEYWSVKDNCPFPELLRDMCREAHEDMMPDDTKYAFIVEALDALEDADEPEDVELEADIYTAQLTAWLASHLERVSYVDDAADVGVEDRGLSFLLMRGQYEEKNAVLRIVRTFIEREVEDDNLPDNADDPDYGIPRNN